MTSKLLESKFKTYKKEPTKRDLKSKNNMSYKYANSPQKITKNNKKNQSINTVPLSQKPDRESTDITANL